ncbi:ATP-dependent DNA ligase [Aureimonas sp. AU40]|uniref:ATP-dependent DNA ligase n=1 Tax=Aureimonas sp. AU40 TaxID=1637747 RepID=UPI000781F4C2|nr:RNA ligase family protein [Aureimonas sp. AU40]
MFSNLEQVVDELDRIAAESGRNEKERLLKAALQDELFRKVVVYAYDPFITFGITPPESGDVRFGKGDGDMRRVEPMLLNLSSRKLTGSEAATEVEKVFGTLSYRAGEALRRIMKKDLRAGINTSTINKAREGTIPVFAIMRAHVFEEKRIKSWPVAVEPKVDGFRGVHMAKGQKPQFYTRSGQEMTSANDLAAEIYAALPKTSYDRDAIAIDGEVKSGSFNQTSGDLRRKSVQADEAIFYVFDVFPSAVFEGEKPASYQVRRQNVEKLVKELHAAGVTRVQQLPRYFANSHEEIYNLFDKFVAQGHEGAMVKIQSGTYKRSKSHDWLKVKPSDTEDLPIVGFFNGEPGTKNADGFGGFILDRDGVHVRVGGGFSDELRKELFDDWCEDAKRLGIDPMVGFKPGFTVDPSISTVGFKLLGRLSEVEFHEVTPDGSLRHPRHLRFRDDKADEQSVPLAA